MSIVIPPQDLRNRRRHTRYALRRPCTLIFRDLSVTAMLEDISLGGAGITLPMHVASYGGFEGLLFRLEDVCRFRSEPRWTSDRRMGLQFAPQAHRAPGLLTLLAELEAVQPGGVARADQDAGFARVVSRGQGTRRPLFPGGTGISRSGATRQP